MVFNERLRALRKERGMTQAEVAEKISIAYRNYQRLEANGNTPNFSNLVQLADLFDVSMDYLAGRTDVLSFPMFDMPAGSLPTPGWSDPDTGLIPLGDMCISLERAKAQAQEYGHSLERELSYLAVHSVLHLLGYDHVDEGPQKAQMREREEAILGRLGITRE